MTEIPQLIFVYNADSGLFHLLADIGRKLLSPGTYNCSLCSITHGYFTEKREWRTFLDSLPVNCTFLHRDEFQQLYPYEKTPFPVIMRRTGHDLNACLDAKELNSCANLAELREKIMHCCLPDGL